MYCSFSCKDENACGLEGFSDGETKLFLTKFSTEFDQKMFIYPNLVYRWPKQRTFFNLSFSLILCKYALYISLIFTVFVNFY